jgi:hypothetical protein
LGAGPCLLRLVERGDLMQHLRLARAAGVRMMCSSKGAGGRRDAPGSGMEGGRGSAGRLQTA